MPNASQTLAPQGHAVPTAAPARPGPAAVVVAVAVLLVLSWRLRDFVTDDSWISVRYAENLANGSGAVWNPGGQRAEGFSNPLLVLLEAAADAAGWSALPAGRALGIAAAVACVVLVYTWGRDVVGEQAAAVGALLTGASAPFALWAVGGLETSLTAAVLTAAVLQLARPDGGRIGVAAALLALLPWLRPEGLVVALAVVGAGEGLALLRSATRRAAAGRVALLAGVPVASQAVLEVVRLGVYGHLLPNSVLYKSGTGELLTVAHKFVDHSLPVLVPAVLGALLLRRRQALLVVPAAVYLAGSLGTLDSANAYSRFFMPVWPQLALVAGVAVALVATRLATRTPVRLSAGHAPLASVVLGAVVAAVALTDVPGGQADVESWSQRYLSCRVAAREDVSRWLVANTPQDTSFSISDAGLVPARAGGRTAIDAFLLNDPLIQGTGPLSPSERADIVHGRHPDLLVLASRDADTFRGAYPTDTAIHRHAGAVGFVPLHVGSGSIPCGYHLFVFGRQG